MAEIDSDAKLPTTRCEKNNPPCTFWFFSGLQGGKGTERRVGQVMRWTHENNRIEKRARREGSLERTEKRKGRRDYNGEDKRENRHYRKLEIRKYS